MLVDRSAAFAAFGDTAPFGLAAIMAAAGDVACSKPATAVAIVIASVADGPHFQGKPAAQHYVRLSSAHREGRTGAWPGEKHQA